MRKTVLSTAVASTLFLVGCGSTSSTDSTAVATSTGYFIDAAVFQADYETSSGIKGETDRFGRFNYKEGDSVKLSIGKLKLGEVAPDTDGLITPRTLAHGDENLTSLLLRTLQALDLDGNTSNGIMLAGNLLEDINETNLEEHNESSLIELIDSGDRHLIDSDYDGEIDVSDDEANSHFENSEREWNEGQRPDEGHEDETVGETNGTEGSQDGEFDLSQYPVSILTQDLKEALAYMGNEERLAYDVYQNLYTYHVAENDDEIKQLKNISEKSEIKHVGIVQDLVNRYALGAEDLSNVSEGVADRNVSFEDMPSGQYDIPAIQNLYDALYAKGIVSTNEALMVGCMVEVTDINDLDRYITQAEVSNATDVVEAFNVLRDGSYNHYWAFDKGLKKVGIENGCYVEGDALLTNKEGVYPTNENGEEG